MFKTEKNESIPSAGSFEMDNMLVNNSVDPKSHLNCTGDHQKCLIRDLEAYEEALKHCTAEELKPYTKAFMQCMSEHDAYRINKKSKSNPF